MSPWQLDVRGKFTSKPNQGTVPSSAARALRGPLGRRIAGALAARAILLPLQPPANQNTPVVKITVCAMVGGSWPRVGRVALCWTCWKKVAWEVMEMTWWPGCRKRGAILDLPAAQFWASARTVSQALVGCGMWTRCDAT